MVVMRSRTIMEERKQREIEWGNFRRSKKVVNNIEKYKRYLSNKKFYSITRKSVEFRENWLKQRCFNKKVLILGCGDGTDSFFLAKHSAIVIGIDISDVALVNAIKTAIEKGVEKKTTFLLMDAENTAFEDNTFDIISVAGVLHHLDINKAFSEIMRVLKPDGEVLCVEPLAYNPVIQLYRKLTPHLRTEWEAKHILSLKSINLSKKYFNKIEFRFFHLATILAVPFRNLPFFNFILNYFEIIDSFILRLPLIKLLSWQIVFILSEPKK